MIFKSEPQQTLRVTCEKDILTFHMYNLFVPFQSLYAVPYWWCHVIFFLANKYTSMLLILILLLPPASCENYMRIKNFSQARAYARTMEISVRCTSMYALIEKLLQNKIRFKDKPNRSIKSSSHMNTGSSTTLCPCGVLHSLSFSCAHTYTPWCALSFNVLAPEKFPRDKTCIQMGFPWYWSGIYTKAYVSASYITRHSKYTRFRILLHPQEIVNTRSRYTLTRSLHLRTHCGPCETYISAAKERQPLNK